MRKVSAGRINTPAMTNTTWKACFGVRYRAAAGRSLGFRWSRAEGSRAITLREAPLGRFVAHRPNLGRSIWRTVDS
jgi:hypothetical protein